VGLSWEKVYDHALEAITEAEWFNMFSVDSDHPKGELFNKLEAMFMTMAMFVVLAPAWR
jgi:hypothetical protein